MTRHALEPGTSPSVTLHLLRHLMEPRSGPLPCPPVLQMPRIQDPKHAPLLLAALHDTWTPLCTSTSTTVEGGYLSLLLQRGGALGPPLGEPAMSKHDVLESVTILTMDPMGTPMEKARTWAMLHQLGVT